MTFKRLKSTVTGLLTGDNTLPDDPDVELALLGMAFSELSNHANSMRLITMNRDSDISRIAAQGDYYYRYPEMPELDDDELDIDEELSYPVARFMASYVSEKRGPIHMGEGKRLVREYNSKVAEMIGAIEEVIL